MNADFLPERITTHRAMRTRLLRQGHLLAITVVALVGLAYFNQDRIDRAEAEVVYLDEQSVNMARQMEMMYDLQTQLADLRIKQRIDSRLGSRVKGTDILGELGRILPKTMALTNLELEAVPVAIKLEPAKGPAGLTAKRTSKKKQRMVNRLKLVISGLSPNNVDVANFIADLSASPLFEEVNMGYAKNIIFRKKVAKEFQVSCFVVR